MLGARILVVDTGPVEGVEALSEALTQAEYSATVGEALGRQGWIGDPGELALETTFMSFTVCWNSTGLSTLWGRPILVGSEEKAVMETQTHSPSSSR